MGMIKEFKEFAVQGNLVDMAIAFVMGGAFAKVSTAFINGIFMPILGQLVAGVDFTKLKYVLAQAKLDESGKVIAEEIAIKYGEFIATTIDFVVVAFVMFLVVKGMNKMKKNDA